MNINYGYIEFLWNKVDTVYIDDSIKFPVKVISFFDISHHLNLSLNWIN